MNFPINHGSKFFIHEPQRQITLLIDGQEFLYNEVSILHTNVVFLFVSVLVFSNGILLSRYPQKEDLDMTGGKIDQMLQGRLLDVKKNIWSF